MMNQNVYEYVKNLVIGKVDKYEKYACYTNTNTNGNYSSNIYDVTCAFGSDSSILNNYRLVISDGLVCDIDTNSYSYNSTNTLERIVCNKGNINRTINNYETIYTNINDTFPSIISDIEYQNKNNVAYSLDLNYFYLIILLLCIPLCLYFLVKMFRIR